MRPVVSSSLVFAFVLSACGGGGGGGGSTPPMSAATNPPSSPSSSTAYTCPTSTTTSSGTAAVVADSASSRRVVRAIPTGNASESSHLLAVTYRTSTGHTAFRIVGTDPSQPAAMRSQLRARPGVIDAQAVQYRYPLTTNAYLTNDPYFKGEAGAIAPLYETGATNGQWDQHIIGLEHAFAYSQSSNGSGITNAGAIGSSSVKLAIIDTGVDVNHPDLAGSRIVRTHCFLTDDNGTSTSGSIVTDEAGHGTDVTGIASATTNNDYGFAGAGGNVSLMLYRVFPTPDDSCTSDTSTDPRCGATDVDIASAIDDAVANGANVINMSFGGGSCSNGQDEDAVEGQAIENAISHNVIVVAASGNGGSEGVTAPACDTGVIAVGASAYNDGRPNGSSYTGSASEYVPSYSQYGSTNVAKSVSSWGIIAPGGDAQNNTDDDNLHWVNNIWTSTPYDSEFAGFYCTSTDVFGETGDCQTEIEGTSMAVAHAAGAAALVLSVSGATGPYATPAAMFRLLCTTADNINDTHEGCGRLNEYRAVATALGDPHLP